MCNEFNKNCLICSSTFQTEDITVTWCSDKCKSKMKKQYCKKCSEEFYHTRNLTYCSDECKKRNCDYCNKIYLPTDSQKFCSHECKEKFHTYKCKACGNKFISKSYAPKKFCSDECRYTYQKLAKIIYKDKFENKKSSNPSKEDLLIIVSSKVNTLLTRKENFLTESYLYTINVNNDYFSEVLKEKVRKRDNNVCYVCENNKDLEVHHVLPRKLGGKNEEDNLITLCAKCHRHIETGNREYAIKKCYENAKVSYGYLDYILEQQSSKVEITNILESKLNLIFNKIVNKHETEEILIEFDGLFSYIEKLKNNNLR